MFPDRIETERLVLEPFTPEYVDVMELYQYVSHRNPHIEEITEHLSWDPHQTPKETRDFLESQAEARREGEDATYVIRPKQGEVSEAQRTGRDKYSRASTRDTRGDASDQSSGEQSDPRDGAGEFAGMTGIHPDWDRRMASFGMWLRKPFWGRGYSSERAAALMEVAFDRLDLELVAVSHQMGNEKSKQAIEEYVEAHGGQHDGLLRNGAIGPDGPVDVHRYTVTREEWREASEQA